MLPLSRHTTLSYTFSILKTILQVSLLRVLNETYSHVVGEENDREDYPEEEIEIEIVIVTDIVIEWRWSAEEEENFTSSKSPGKMNPYVYFFGVDWAFEGALGSGGGF